VCYSLRFNAPTMLPAGHRPATSWVHYVGDFREQRTCIKFCFKLGKTATECYEILKTAFGEPSAFLQGEFQELTIQ
jgi:hypothetical protein